MGSNPSSLQQALGGLSLAPIPGATFEAETYPKILKALDQIMAAQKRVSPDFYEGNLGNLFSTLRNYQQAIQKETGTLEPAAGQLQKLKSGTRTKDLLVSELKAGGREAKQADPNLRSGDVFHKMQFPPKLIQSALKDLEELLANIYGNK